MILVDVPPAAANTQSDSARENAPPSPSQKTARVISLDALRGFDMFWILGADAVVRQLAKVFHWQPIQVMHYQLEHAKWEGFRAYDLIFPMFVFIAGVSLVFSLGKQLAIGGRRAAVRRIIIRGVILFLLGILYSGGLSGKFTDIRIMGVLQRIAISYTAAALLFLFLRPRGLAIVAAGILLAYWLFLAFVPVPGVGHASFAEGQNWTNYLDARFLPLRKYDGDHDPEGLLSTLPAIAGCMLGIFAGLLLKSGRPRPIAKVGILLVAGVACGALGYAWGRAFPAAPRLQFPIIKKIWTSSFVLVTAGYATVLLALFYLVIDVIKFQFWARPFVWIGANAITLYLVCNVFKFSSLANRFIGGEFKTRVLQTYGDIAVSALALLFVFLLARFLYRRQIFLRV